MAIPIQKLLNIPQINFDIDIELKQHCAFVDTSTQLDFLEIRPPPVVTPPTQGQLQSRDQTQSNRFLKPRPQPFLPAHNNRAKLFSIASFIEKYHGALESMYPYAKYNFLVLNLSMCKDYHGYFENVKSYEFSYNGIRLCAYVFETGIFTCDNVTNKPLWKFTQGYRYLSAILETESIAHRAITTTVWANVKSNTCGNLEGPFNYAYYWGNKFIREILVKTVQKPNSTDKILSEIIIVTDNDNNDNNDNNNNNNNNNNNHNDNHINKKMKKQNLQKGYKPEVHSIQLSRGDSIIGISVKADHHHIYAIQFHFIGTESHCRSSFWIGGEKGDKNTFRNTPKGIYGSFGAYINSIGVFSERQ